MGLTALCPMQITKYVEREIMNHRSLMHPHIVQFKEVSLLTVTAHKHSAYLSVHVSGVLRAFSQVL